MGAETKGLRPVPRVLLRTVRWEHPRAGQPEPPRAVGWERRRVGLPAIPLAVLLVPPPMVRWERLRVGLRGLPLAGLRDLLPGLASRSWLNRKSGREVSKPNLLATRKPKVETPFHRIYSRQHNVEALSNPAHHVLNRLARFFSGRIDAVAE